MAEPACTILQCHHLKRALHQISIILKQEHETISHHLIIALGWYLRVTVFFWKHPNSQHPFSELVLSCHNTIQLRASFQMSQY